MRCPNRDLFIQGVCPAFAAQTPYGVRIPGKVSAHSLRLPSPSYQ